MSDAREIEITTAMVDAATRILNQSGVPEYPTPSNRAVVREMLEAAISAGGFSVRKTATS